MSNRGRHYYDPITQPPLAEGERRDVSRIEVFQDPADATLRRWCGRLINPDGSLSEERQIEDTDHDRVIELARQQWPGLDVYELQDPGEDSTWEGMGPSPRLWQSNIDQYVSDATTTVTLHPEMLTDGTIPPALEDGQVSLRLIPVSQPGAYVLLDDICLLLESWAVQYEEGKNPSGAMALREAADTLKEIK